MRPQYSIVTPPESEPITLDQASDQLRVDSVDDVNHITALISVAREYADSVTGRVSGSSEWRMISPCWGAFAGLIQLHRTPLVSVESVSYYAPGETGLTVVDPDDYIVITGSEPGGIYFAGSLPALETRPDAVQIEFTAGYTSADLVPAVHRHAIKMLVTHFYEIRMPVIVGTIATEIPFGIRALLENQKIGGWLG